MQQVQSRYEPRDGRLVQSIAKYECKCGVKLTVSDLKTVSNAQSESEQP